MFQLLFLKIHTFLYHLNCCLTDLGGFKPVIDESSGEITGYKTTIGGADTVFPFKSIYEAAFTFFRSGIIEVHHIIKNNKTVVGGVGNMGSISGDRMTIVCSSNGKVIAKTDGTYGYATSNNMVIRELKAGQTIVSLNGDRDCCCIAL